MLAKRIVILSVLMAAGACGAWLEPAPPTGPVVTGTDVPAVGRTYGAGLSADAQAVELSQLIADPTAYNGKKVRVEGQVVGVCAKRGCWIELAGAGGKGQLKVKVDDGVIVFPTEEQGHWAVAEGIAAKIVLDLEKSRAYQAEQAREAGKEFDPASVTEPLTFAMLKGQGAIIRDQR